MEFGIKIRRTHLYKPARKTIISMETYFLHLLLVVVFKRCTDKWHRSSIKVISLISLIICFASRKLNKQRFRKNDFKLCAQGTFRHEIEKDLYVESIFLNFLLIEVVKLLIHANRLYKVPFSLQQDSLWTSNSFTFFLRKKLDFVM